MVAYKKLKTIENYKPSAPKNGRDKNTGVGRLREVPTVGF